MNQSEPKLFDAPLGEVSLPGLDSRIDARRRDDRIRQRRSRANRRLAKRRYEHSLEVNAEVEGIDLENFDPRRLTQTQFIAIIDNQVSVSSAIIERTTEFYLHFWGHFRFVMTASTLGPTFASIVFRTLEAEDVPRSLPTERAIVETARAIHEGGQRITRARVKTELAKRGLILLDEQPLDCFNEKLPNSVDTLDVTEKAYALKGAS